MSIVEKQRSASTARADTSWRNLANCRYMSPRLFFPAGTTGSAVDEIEAAKSLCRACPVKDDCLLFAFETNQDAGIWGGTTEDERRKLRRAWVAGRRRKAGELAGPSHDSMRQNPKGQVNRTWDSYSGSSSSSSYSP